jgi:hypothetical protein
MAMTFSEPQQLYKKNLRTEDIYGYTRLHLWVNRQLGKANHCSNDPNHTAKRFHWANISGDYRKDLNDWRQLCASCNVKEGVTDNTRQLNRLKARGNTYHNTPILMVYPNGSWIKFPSSKAAAKHVSILHTGISNVLAGRAKTAGGYRWRRVVS